MDERKRIADQYKSQGNSYFAQQLYKEAIKCYTNAIIQYPDIPTYFTNRALCYIRTGEYEKAIPDCRKAIDIDSSLVKGHYFLGQALLETNDSSFIMQATSALKKAYALSIEQKVEFAEEVGRSYLQAKKKKWEIQDRKRREDASDLFRYLTGLMERETNRQLNQLHDGSEAREDVLRNHRERLTQLDGLFAAADDAGQKRDVPDYLCDKISFEIIADPVITPSGITYGRHEIMQHFKKIGHFDPLTRKPLSERDLIPNLALKDCVDDFLSKNGWAVDY